MGQAISPSVERRYSLARVCRVLEIPCSKVYAARSRRLAPVPPRKRGPKTAFTDAGLTDQIRAVLAMAVPEWLAAIMLPAWPERYARRTTDDRLPEKQAERDARAATISVDGWVLLDALAADDAPPRPADLPAVAVLRRT